MVIRAATDDDLPRLLTLVTAAYRGDSARRGWTHEADLVSGPRTDLAMLKALIDDPEGAILVAELRGIPVGCVNAKVLVGGDEVRTGYLGMLAVDPDQQGSGVGRRLVTCAEEFARVRGCRAITMTVIMDRSALIDWYARQGYALTGERAPFPDDPRFGTPTRPLEFVILRKPLA
jgi:ribosomal protein S18 acetylase RimI-like enzyme